MGLGMSRYAVQEQGVSGDVIRARHIMSAPVFSLQAEATVEQATTVFAERRYRHIPILSPDGTLVGLISDRDVLRFQAENHGKGGGELLSKVMVNEVLVATSDTPVRELARTMFDERIGSLPIVTNDGTIDGIITRSDIIRSVIAFGPMSVIA